MEDGVTTLYVGAHYQINDGKVIKYYFAGTQMIAMRTDGVLNYLLADHLGSTSLVTDAAGTIIAETRYTPYGETRIASGASPTDYLYTSQRQEAGLGLYFYNARWYDPALARFTQADTIVPGAGNPQAFDRYAYVLNNPLLYNDPSGHGSECLTSANRQACEAQYNDVSPGVSPQPQPPYENIPTLTPTPYRISTSTPTPTATPSILPIVERKKYLAGIFDPWNGVAYPNAVNPDAGINWFEIEDLYQENKIDINILVLSRESNKLTFYDINDSPAGEIIPHLLMRANHVPYQIFLNQLRIPHDIEHHITNYEPHYLNALMVQYPEALEDAISYYNNIYPDAIQESIQDFGPGLVGPDSSNLYEFGLD